MATPKRLLPKGFKNQGWRKKIQDGKKIEERPDAVHPTRRVAQIVPVPEMRSRRFPGRANAPTPASARPHRLSGTVRRQTGLEHM